MNYGTDFSWHNRNWLRTAQEKLTCAFCGRPIRVGNKYYEVDLRPEQSKDVPVHQKCEAAFCHPSHCGCYFCLGPKKFV